MNEIMKQENTLPTSSDSQDLRAWGKSEFTAKDLIIPKILIMQPSSPHVIDEKAKFGEFINSLTGAVIGAYDKPIKFVPILMQKIWVISKKIKDAKGKEDWDYVRTEPCTPDNENAQWNYIEDGVELKRDMTRNFYIMLDGDSTPSLLSLKGTSARSGQVLATQMYSLNAMSNLPPCGCIMSMGGTKNKNEKGSYIVADIKVVARTPKETVDLAFYWFQAIKLGIIKDDPNLYKEKEVQIEMFDKDSKF